jgi:hypothetical protein
MRTLCRKSVTTAKNWFCRISLKMLKKIGSPRTPIPKKQESHTKKCRVFERPNASNPPVGLALVFQGVCNESFVKFYLAF